MHLKQLLLHCFSRKFFVFILLGSPVYHQPGVIDFSQMITSCMLREVTQINVVFRCLNVVLGAFDFKHRISWDFWADILIPTPLLPPWPHRFCVRRSHQKKAVYRRNANEI